jgi:hypothetical protein
MGFTKFGISKPLGPVQIPAEPEKPHADKPTIKSAEGVDTCTVTQSQDK